MAGEIMGDPVPIDAATVRRALWRVSVQVRWMPCPGPLLAYALLRGNVWWDDPDAIAWCIAGAIAVDAGIVGLARTKRDPDPLVVVVRSMRPLVAMGVLGVHAFHELIEAERRWTHADAKAWMKAVAAKLEDDPCQDS